MQITMFQIATILPSQKHIRNLNTGNCVESLNLKTHKIKNNNNNIADKHKLETKQYVPITISIRIKI